MPSNKLKTLVYAGSLAALVFMSGCGEDITTTTRLLPGGGIERAVSLENAESTPPADWGPIPVDATWAASTSPGRGREPNSGEPLYVHTVTRRFSSARELGALLSKLPADGAMLVPEISWAKKWKGFYNVYTFREAYPVLSSFRHVPARDFFSPEELALLSKALADEKTAPEGRSEKETDALGDKYMKWTARCLAEDLLQAVRREADDLGDARSSRWLRDDREPILAAMIEALDVPEHNPELGPGPYTAKLDEILGTEYFRGLADRKSPALGAWEKRRRFFDAYAINTFPFRLVLPGLITSTNARDVEGNTVSWKLSIIGLTLEDFEMTAESRAVNWGGVGLAGLGLLVLAALAVRGAWALRRRGRGGISRSSS